MSGSAGEVLQQLRAIIGELDEAVVAASSAQEKARSAYSLFDEAATGSAHPQMSIARQEADIAAAKAGKVAALLAKTANTFSEYANHIVPGVVPTRAAAPEVTRSGAQLSPPSAQGPLMKRLAGRLATVRNSDDGLQGIGKIGNNIQDAVRPGGAVVPRSSAPAYRATETQGAHAGDALVAAFTLALVVMKATDVAVRPTVRPGRVTARRVGMTMTMDDNTMFLRAILRQDWDSYDEFMARYAGEGRGTPVAIIGSAFNLAVKRRFEPEKDVQEIIKFVADARAFLAEGRNLPPREAEALVCANLDLEAPWMEEIIDRLDVVTIAEIEGQLLFKLISDENLSDDQLDEFLTEAERLLEEWQAQA